MIAALENLRALRRDQLSKGEDALYSVGVQLANDELPDIAKALAPYFPGNQIDEGVNRLERLVPVLREQQSLRKQADTFEKAIDDQHATSQSLTDARKAQERNHVEMAAAVARAEGAYFAAAQRVERASAADVKANDLDATVKKILAGVA